MFTSQPMSPLGTKLYAAQPLSTWNLCLFCWQLFCLEQTVQQHSAELAIAKAAPGVSELLESCTPGHLEKCAAAGSTSTPEVLAQKQRQGLAGTLVWCSAQTAD